MVTSVIDLKNCPANLSLDEHVPLIVGRFISSRAEALQVWMLLLAHLPFWLQIVYLPLSSLSHH